MFKRTIAGLVLAAALLAAVFTGSGSASSTTWTDTATQAVNLTGATFLGPLAGSTPLRLVVGLALRNGTTAPTSSQASRVASYLTSQGFTSVQIQPNNLMVSANATASQAQKAFHTFLSSYAVNGQTVYTNVKKAQVPATLGGIVAAVLGLSDVTQYGSQPRSQPVQTPLTGYTPQGFWRAYDASAVPRASSTSIAVIAEGDVTGVVTDLRKAETAYNLPKVPVSVVHAGLASSDTAGADEWDLDSQYTTGMAGAVKKLTFYTATSMTDQDIALAFNRWESDGTAKVANASFGICETFAYLDGSMTLDDEVFNLAAAKGMSLFSSTGDTGSTCGFVLPTNGVPLTGLPEVEYPSASPYVVAVGGTRLLTDSTDKYVAETAWEAGGGGISQHEPSPFWQANTVVSNTGCNCKGLPDIAMDAALDTGALVYVDGQQELIGGTSLSSPLAVGSWARIESAHANSLGFAARAMYRVYQRTNPGLTDLNPVVGLNDVIAGANGFYTAKPGWDYATGLGSLDVAKLSRRLG